MVEKAKVFVAEDDPSIQQVIKWFLSKGGHEVVLQAQTLSEALRSIKQFEKLGIQIAVIDGNLTPGDISGSDGYQLATAIRQLAPNVTTIGMSVLSVDGVDIDLGKNRISELGKAVTELQTPNIT